MSPEKEKAVRRLYDLAEQKDIAGFVAAFTERDIHGQIDQCDLPWS